MHWIDELKAGRKAVLWESFQRASEKQVERLEYALNRTLPDDFREFYTEIGYGEWPAKYGGGIYSLIKYLS